MDRRRRAARTVALMSLFTMTDTQVDVPIASFDGDGSDLISLIVAINSVDGCTETNVTRAGKNLCDSAAFESGLLATSIGSDINAVTSSTRYAHSGIMPAKAALAVTVKTLDLAKIEYASVVAYVGDKVAWTAAQSFSSSVLSKTWTIPANTYEKLRVNIGAPSGVVADVANTEVQVEAGSATAYEPYQGETYTITFPTEAGTVYDATLDVINGKLTVSSNVYDTNLVSIQTLIGKNNIWADTGDIKYIEYNI